MAKNDPTTPLYQATITGTGMLPNDSMIDDERAGWNGPTPDRAQQDQMVDGPEMPAGNVDLAPPPGSFTGHVDITEDERNDNLLSGTRYTMLGGDDD